MIFLDERGSGISVLAAWHDDDDDDDDIYTHLHTHAFIYISECVYVCTK